MDKYSVLMSLYYKEQPRYLRQALDSMINQTIAPDEIVLVEDGPLTDELYQVVNEYRKNNPGLFKIVVNKENLGLGEALNSGLKVCRNELVARMDTDDISIPDRLNQQLKLFEQNCGLDIVGGDISEFLVDESSIIGVRRVPKEDESIKRYMKSRCAMNHVSVVFKKSTVSLAGGYKSCFFNEDYYLWIRMMEKGAVFQNTGSVLVNVRVGEGMYARRGGRDYFRSETSIQRYMYRHGIINGYEYIRNVIVRFILQIIMPASLRKIAYNIFARN